MSAQYCPEPTRPHTSRCDQYLRCDKLSTGDHVWTTVQCQQGLVYQQPMGTCVVPDSDWECDLSAENDRDRSEENVYGVDSELDSESRASADDIEDHPIFSSEPEYSGDGSLDTLSYESETESAPAQTSTIARQDVLQQPSALSTQTPNDVTANQDKNETLTELQLSEQLKRFIEQQKTWIANNLKQRKYLSAVGTKKTEDHSSSLREVDKPKPPKTDPGPSSSQKHTGGLVSEDLIRNVLSISQQIISNQKESAALKPSVEQKPIVTPIYIPYPVGAVPGPTARPHPTNTNAAASPTGASFNNLPHNNYFTMYDGNSQFPANVSTTAIQQRPPVLYDAFGHRILPFQSFPPYVTAPSGYQVVNSGYNPYYTGVQQPHGGRYPSIFSPQAGAPLNGPPDYYHGQYQPEPGPVYGYAGSQQQIRYGPPHHGPAASFDRNDLSDPSLSDENDALDSTEDEDEDEEDDAPISAFSDEYNDEVAPPEETDDEPTSHLKRKLFALDDERTLDYEEYKDRILPLLRANPGDTRITLLTCSLGSRQPNRTDCFRYYVCNPHNGAFQTFTCPANTAFNKNTRLCDSVSYKPCQTATSGPKRQVSVRRQKPQAHRKRIKEQPAEKELLRKAQKYVELIRRQALKVMGPSNGNSQQAVATVAQPQARPPAKVHRRKSSSLAAKRRVASATTTTTTTRAPVKVARCRLEGRMPDPNDRINYYVCHRKSEKKFTKLKMACPPNLIYCAESQYCTLATNC
ncbi:uncharacterized protein LOC128276336 [Anopheles cruzii]|uniref:uncharacterized protein LOC128276336 n=1 Tax=Anopheles cruzii TaxID=68878 RepID=UPI0022EC3D60|nr:uncharacterized protein LOC128276336 [Anopheles cruzii]